MSTTPTSPTAPSSPSWPRTGPTTSSKGARTTSPRGRSAFTSWWRPSRDDLVDAGASLGFVAIGAVGWLSVYIGASGLVVAVVGALLGVLAAWLSAARKLSPLSTLGVALAAFVVGAGPAVPSSAVAGFLPGPGTPAALVDGLVAAWADLVTTALPVDLSTGLGVVPYLCGFLAGGGAMLLARRTTAPLLPAAPPLVALIASLVLGDLQPVNVVVQGGGFALGALVWGAVREGRPRRSLDGEVYWPRIIAGAVMVAAVGAIAVLLAPVLPGSTTTDRTVVRRDVVPPPDPRAYASPLASLRAYRKEGRDRTYFVVDGLRKGDRLRLATMDTYDGVVWRVSADGGEGGRFQRAGTLIDVPAGVRRDLTIEVVGYTGVWVPTLGRTSSGRGALRAISFAGPSADAVGSSFRYSRATDTAATPLPLSRGDRLDIQARDVGSRSLEAGKVAVIDPTVLSGAEAIAVKARAKAGSGSPLAQVKAIETYLHDGYFSDSPKDAEAVARTRAGHSVARLTDFLSRGEKPVGNAEQYAAAMALMVTTLGLPARVVMGFTPKDSGDRVAIKGKDADAWVEVYFQGMGWRSFTPTPPETNVPKSSPPPPDDSDVSQQPVEPPNQVNPPDSIPEDAQRKKQKEEKPEKAEAGSGLPSWVGALVAYVGFPLLVVGAVLALILGLKAVRRRRRRTRGTVVDQVNGAWLEMLDRLRDVGHWPSQAATRREVVAAAAEEGHWSEGDEFADRVDAHMFGPADPDAVGVAATWEALDDQVASLHRQISRGRRVRAAVSLASLRPNRRGPARRRPNRAPTPTREPSRASNPAAGPPEAGPNEAPASSLVNGPQGTARPQHDDGPNGPTHPPQGNPPGQSGSLEL